MTLDIALTGDLILDVPDPDHWLSGIAPVLRAADLAIGHLEVPHTLRGQEMQGDVPAPGANPDHLDALARAGIGAVSMAGNHMADCGPEGIADTVARLDALAIAHSGAGLDLNEAKATAFIDRGDLTVALLSYNCVGPEISWADEHHAGSNYVVTRPRDGGTCRPQAELVTADPASVATMQAEVAAARSRADVVVVALHKGVTHRPATLAPYERPLAHAAIDAGADIVAGHHAHIVQGIELYRGRPIFHGLGNGCVVTHALSPGQDHAARAEWVERRKRMFGFEPDPAYTLAPFHPEAVNGMIGVVRLENEGQLAFGFIPIKFEAPGRPVVATGASGDQIITYVRATGVKAGLAEIDGVLTAGAYWITP